MYGSMANIQYATAEIWRGENEEGKIKEITGQKYNVHICYTGQP